MREQFNNYMDVKAPTKLKKLFEELSQEDGIMLQCCFEEFAKLSGQIEPMVTKSEHTEGSFASGAAVKGNVVERKSDKHRFVVYGHNIEEVNNDIENYNFICEKPHEDGRFDYLCNNLWCRCR